jgi:predicted PurR-regulated permease PerM
MASDTGPMNLSALAQRTATAAAVVTVFAAVAGAIIFASDMFLLVFAGTLLSVLLRGLATPLASRTGLPYGLAVAVVVIGLLSLSAGVGLLLAPSFTSQTHDLREQLPDALGRVRSRIQGIDWLDGLLGGLPSADTIVGRRADVWSRIAGFFSTALGLLTDVVVIAFVGLYVAAAPSLYRQGLLALIPAWHRSRADDLLSTIDHTLWWWLIAKLIAMVIVGVLTTAGLWWLGIPAPAALGILAALLTFIPNFGPVLSAAPAVLLALTEGVKDTGFVLLLYTAIQTVESFFITPIIERRTIRLAPALTVSAQLLLGMVAGGLGLLVATPLCATILVLVRELYVKQLPARTKSA